MITKFKLYNESLKNKLKGKSDDEINLIIKNKLNKKDLTWWDYAKYWVIGNDDIKSIIESKCDEGEKETLRRVIKTYINYNIDDEYVIPNDIQYFSLFNNTNESLKDKLKGKSDDEINLIVKNKLNINDDIISIKIRKPITDYVKHRFFKGIDIYNLEYVDYDDEYVIVKGKPYDVMDFIKNYKGFRNETRLINYIKKFNI